MRKVQKTSEPNFILPKTEYTVKKIISSVSSFFERTEIAFSGIYIVYTVLRVLFMEKFFLLNCVLLAIAVTTFAMEIFRKIFNWSKYNVFNKCLLVVRRVVCLFITVIVFLSLFDSTKILHAYEVIFAVIGALCFIMCILGDVFNATIPVWADEVLDSFKKDIEVKGLVSRSINQIKVAADQDEVFTKKAVQTVTFGSGLLLFKGLRKLIHGNKK
ncbi:MAG: hypothetical protein MJ169_02505 [Treponema sp.]|nr:hypothetical protein [Treponema sp.]